MGVDGGNVGIGTINPSQKLDVAGKVKVGDDTAAAAEGSIRYNSSTHDLEGYVNGEWKSLTATGTGGGTGSGLGGNCICRLNCQGNNYYYDMDCGTGWSQRFWWGTSAYGSCATTIGVDFYFPCSKDTGSILTGDLYGGFRTSSDCTAADGTVIQDGSTKFCRFTASSCPSGWNPYLNWTTTSANTCTGTTGCDGKGLYGQYFSYPGAPNQAFTQGSLVMSRTDSKVDFNWGNNAPDPSVPDDYFAVRWTGRVQAPVTGIYTFYVASDDGNRLWVNGQQLTNDWHDHGLTETSGTISLTAGQKYDIKLEYYDNVDGARVHLSWSYPGQGKTIIPQSQLGQSGSETSCTIGSHAWGNTAPETCTYNNAAWNLSTYNGYLCFGSYNGCYRTDLTSCWSGEVGGGWTTSCDPMCSQSSSCPIDNSYCSTQAQTCKDVIQIGCY
jgi:hypothetical protein